MNCQKLLWINLFALYLVVCCCSSEVDKEINIDEQNNSSSVEEDTNEDATILNTASVEDNLNSTESETADSIEVEIFLINFPISIIKLK